MRTVPHGGEPAGLLTRAPDAPRPLIDLSTGINPWPYPVGEVAPEVWQRLPRQADTTAARAALGAYLGLTDPDAHLALVPGSESAIQRLPEVIAPTRVAVLAPSYASHAAAWAAAGHAVTGLSAAALGNSDAPVIVLANPNNPDGTAFAAADLRTLAERLAARGGLLVVDEAFADLTPAQSLAAEAPNLGAVVLRSFGKFFGLAGLRAGAVAGPPALLRRLEARMGAWPVSGPALAVLARAYRDTTWIAATRARLADAAAALDADLGAAGLAVRGGTDLFRLVESAAAPAVQAALERHGIAARAFETHPTWLRLGLPADTAARRRLQSALKEIDTT